MKLLEANKVKEAHGQESSTMEVIDSKPPLEPSNIINANSSNGHHTSTNSKVNKTKYINKYEFLLSDGTEEAASKLPGSKKTEDEYLEYTEEGHPSFVLAGINHLRKQRQFCDMTLVVEDNELPVHRAVLAACSPYMFDFLSRLEETSESQPTFKLKDVPYDGFHFLLDYMYTGRLLVPVHHVPLVYATALGLKMDSAARACASFLSNHMTAANCLGIRRFTKDKVFKQTVDTYIRSNLADIMLSKSFFGLTDLQVEVVGLDESISDEAMERRLFSLIVDWAKNNLNDLKPKMDRLTEKVNVLYLGSDNILRDCAEVQDSNLSSDDDVVQDYKIMARRRSNAPSKGSNQRPIANGNGGQPFLKFSLNPEEAVSLSEREWSIVATSKTSENAYVAIALLNGSLMVISVHVRTPVPAGSDTSGNSLVPNSPPLTAHIKTQPSPILRKASITPLGCMFMARCAMGAVELDGKLVVCGGYDRGDCIQAVEAFSVEDNLWTQLPSMNRARARLSASVLNGCIYVSGGSDGWKELSCVEKYDPAVGKWSYVANMLKERSSHGMATLKGKLYCVGGSEGQRSIATCEVYDPSTNKWSRIASLNTARSQTFVCAVNGLLFAIGGTDLWNSLNTVEIYDPEKDEWIIGSGLNIVRRGAGVGIADGVVVVAGGSDGTQSLASTEIYDFQTNTWTVGPPLNVPRANLSVVTVGKRLFAVGGFSGKKFLTTLEWLDLEGMEWFGHTPRHKIEGGARNSNGAEVLQEPAGIPSDKIEKGTVTLEINVAARIEELKKAQPVCVASRGENNKGHLEGEKGEENSGRSNAQKKVKGSSNLEVKEDKLDSGATKEEDEVSS